MESEPSEIQFKNGSDYAVVACYLELYEEGEVKHINGPSHAPSHHCKHEDKLTYNNTKFKLYI